MLSTSRIKPPPTLRSFTVMPRTEKMSWPANKISTDKPTAVIMACRVSRLRSAVVSFSVTLR